MDITTIEKIARLARIGLKADEKVAMAAELEKILVWIEGLNQVDTSSVDALIHASEQKLPLREDVVTDGGYASDILKNAPARVQDYFSVPKVVG